jgi:hypothetical protein
MKTYKNSRPIEFDEIQVGDWVLLEDNFGLFPKGQEYFIIGKNFQDNFIEVSSPNFLAWNRIILLKSYSDILRYILIGKSKPSFWYNLLKIPVMCPLKRVDL